MDILKLRFKWRGSQFFRLYQESVVNQFFGWIRIRGKYPFDDRVKDLQGRPLGMFFYNQRAIFFLSALIFVVGLLLSAWFLPSTEEMLRNIRFLTVFWIVGVIITVALHPIFKRKLRGWAASIMPFDYPPLFDLYFFLDWLLVFSLVIIGRSQGLQLDAFTFLLFANTVVYSTYIRGGRNLLRIVSVVISLFIITLLLYPGIHVADAEPRWFYAILYAGPIISTLLASVALVTGISLLRSLEQQVTQHRLELLGEYQSILSHPAISPHISEDASALEQPTEIQFQQQVQTVLEKLCSLDSPFWFDAACLWHKEHHEYRGKVFLPGPHVNFDKADEYGDGINSTAWLLDPEALTMITSLLYYFGEGQLTHPQFRNRQDVPAAFIPISRAGSNVGVLAVYGREGGARLQRQEEGFLKSLGAIISNTMEQWEGRYRTFPQVEMDNLFKYDALKDVFWHAADIMKKYLVAEGCMVIFRRDPKNDGEMEITAWVGFDDSILINKYKVGEGLTGLCAETGETIRCDDVPRNAELFDTHLLEGMRVAHGKEIHSWMAIPIGPKGRNYGVMKVINRSLRCKWFTKEDQRLGESLALRLQVIIEKFIHFEMLSTAMEEANKQSEEAKQKSEEATAEKKRAEDTAAKRQEDLMIITHQLQAPLSSVIGAVTSLQRKVLSRDVKNTLDYIQALVDDGLTFCYGTTTSLALTAGKKAHFDIAVFDATTELDMLCKRLQKTNARYDLNFSFYKAEGFPALHMDKDVFTSVTYSLIHNAMKYSDELSQVSLLCVFKDGEPVIEVSSVGEPIQRNETESIFEKFKRGRIIEETGRHHRGVGLGLWVARKLMREIGGDLRVILPPKHPRLAIFVMHFPQSEAPDNRNLSPTLT